MAEENESLLPPAVAAASGQQDEEFLHGSLRNMMMNKSGSIKHCVGSPLIRKSPFKAQKESPTSTTYDSTTTTTAKTTKTTTTISKKLVWTVNITHLTSVLFLAGIIYGWAPLKLILIAEGQYSEICHNNSETTTTTAEDTNTAIDNNNTDRMLTIDDDVCTEQMDKYNLIFTFGQFWLSFCSLPVGSLLDYFTTIAKRQMVHYYFLVTAIIMLVGLLLFAFSDTHAGRYDFILGYTLISIGSSMTYLGSFPASFLLPNYQSGILASASCLFDASSVIFFVFYRFFLLEQKHNTLSPSILGAFFQYCTRRNMFLALAVFACILYSIIIYCWIALQQGNWKVYIEQENQKLQQEKLAAAVKEEEEEEEEKDNNNTATTTDNDNNNNTSSGGSKLHDLSLYQQLKTYDYLVAVMFASIHMLRCNFYIETVNEILYSIGDYFSHYANMFSYIMPCGVIFVPLIDLVIRRMGIINTLHTTNLLGLLFGLLLMLATPTFKASSLLLNIQALNFIIFTCFRAFLYSTINTFIATTFGIKTMGRIIGCTFTIAAIFSLLQYPAAYVAEYIQHHNFSMMNGIMLCLCGLPILLMCFYEPYPNISASETRTRINNRDG